MATRKKYAFISYSHRDSRIARWLQRKLESYRLPAEIHNKYEDSRYLRPIFRDRADLGVGVLNDELRKHLESSKYLIVVCSPQSAASKWVNDEIRTFLEWGRAEYIIPFIVSGDITSQGEDNPIPTVLRTYFEEHPEMELLGVDTRESGATKAYIRVVSRMLDLEFDELWKRHLRFQRHKIAIASIATTLLLAIGYWFATPLTLILQLHDAGHTLPLPLDAIVTIDGKEHRPTSLNDTIVVNDLPGYYRLQDIDVEFQATYYENISLDAPLGVGRCNSTTLELQRDNTFSTYAGKIVDANGIAIEGVLVDIEGHTATTDSNGQFKIEFDLASQSTEKHIQLSKDGYIDYQRDDECPSENICYVLHKVI